MQTKKTMLKSLRYLGFYLLKYIISLLCNTLKINYRNCDVIKNLESQNRNYVLAFWHGDMLVPWYINRNKKFGALVSSSKDGQLLVNILKHWNYKVARGSSNEGGKEALKKLIEFAGDGLSVAITPDGPKGPIRKMKPGAVVLAQRAGIPLVLCGVKYQNYFELNSWDKFKIPKPFSKVDLAFSDEIHINNGLSREKTTKIIENCEISLNNLIN